jgi:hypothetical protein
MIESKWTHLTPDETTIILDALSSFRGAPRVDGAKIDALISKLTEAEPQPNITIGVHGGLVEWTSGNPFPIRICDYDEEGADSVDYDEQGRPCHIWLEPADTAATE